MLVFTRLECYALAHSNATIDLACLTTLPCVKHSRPCVICLMESGIDYQESRI